MDISIKEGSRAFITGMSGSGKTTLSLKLCEAMPSPLIIVDTKYDPSIKQWGMKNGVPVKVMRKMIPWQSIKEDIIIRPDPSWIAEPEDIDWWLGQAFYCRSVPSIFIDEGYMVGATNTRMGEGVTGLWTRGRAFGMRCLIGTQRPAFISKFVITESDVLFIGMLKSEDDRKTLLKCTGLPEVKVEQEANRFLYVRQNGAPVVSLKKLDIAAPSLYAGKDRRNTRRPMHETAAWWKFWEKD
jgi:energy-coupling factor transporter ATP-binding protein EcfA2